MYASGNSDGLSSLLAAPIICAYNSSLEIYSEERVGEEITPPCSKSTACFVSFLDSYLPIAFSI